MELYFVFLIAAIISWSISAPLIQKGMKFSNTNFKTAQALLVSFGIGFALLFLFAGRIGTLSFEAMIFSFLAGLLTFPVGTGLFYFTIGKISAKNVLPFIYLKIPFALLLSYMILKENFILNINILIGMIVLISGLVLVSRSMNQKKMKQNKEEMFRDIAFAVMIPMIWALGEVSIKLGMGGSVIYPVVSIFYSLSFGVFITICIVLILSIISIKKKLRFVQEDFMPRKAYIYFAGHGLFSIFIAYTLYYWAIGIGSVSLSVLLVAIWPLLAVLLSIIVEKVQRISFNGNIKLLIIGVILCFVSEVLILTGL
jgi:drug/metabolite transporter (DMT)-like permease